MDNEMIERCELALENKFKAFIEFNSGLPFSEAKVSLPSKNIWREYSLTIIKAMREPTDYMRNKYHTMAQGEVFWDAHWERAIDAIIGDM